MTLALISDPYFYAVAVPAVLLMGVNKSGFGSGFGALAVPMMALAVPMMALAVPMMALAVWDAVR